MYIPCNDRRRFLESACLLELLEQRRGDPSSEFSEFDINNDDQLKRAFLQAVAWVCASKPGGDHVSAACLEEGVLPVIRVAQNTTSMGLANTNTIDQDLANVQGLLQVLKEY